MMQVPNGLELQVVGWPCIPHVGWPVAYRTLQRQHWRAIDVLLNSSARVAPSDPLAVELLRAQDGPEAGGSCLGA
jgi:hypothetical protein